MAGTNHNGQRISIWSFLELIFQALADLGERFFVGPRERGLPTTIRLPDKGEPDRSSPSNGLSARIGYYLPPKNQEPTGGGWFAATAVGNYLVSIIGMLWGSLPLWQLWSILIVLCLISALFIFSIMKKLENATK